jgi:hypothetical protein
VGENIADRLDLPALAATGHLSVPSTALIPPRPTHIPRVGSLSHLHTLSLPPPSRPLSESRNVRGRGTGQRSRAALPQTNRQTGRRLVRSDLDLDMVGDRVPAIGRELVRAEYHRAISVGYVQGPDGLGGSLVGVCVRDSAQASQAVRSVTRKGDVHVTYCT